MQIKVVINPIPKIIWNKSISLVILKEKRVLKRIKIIILSKKDKNINMKNSFYLVNKIIFEKKVDKMEKTNILRNKKNNNSLKKKKLQKEKLTMNFSENDNQQII